MAGCKYSLFRVIAGRFFSLLLLISFLLIAACKTSCIVHPKNGTALDQSHGTLQQGITSNERLSNKNSRVPSNVSRALISSSTSSLPEAQSMGRRFNISANKTPARAFFMGLVSGTRYNMVVNPGVKGEITLELKDVTLDETLEAVRDAYGFEFHRTSYGYEVMPPEMESQIFNVNYLDIKRTGKSLTELISGEITSVVGSTTAGNSNATNTNIPANTAPAQPSTSSSVETKSDMNFWKDLETTLKQIVNIENGSSVAVNAQAGIVIVHGYPHDIHQVARFLDRIQSNMDKQVILEAKILEVDLNDQFQAGIDWNLFGNVAAGQGGIAQTGTQLVPPNTSIQPLSKSAIFAINVNGDFGGLINLLQTQGTVQVLSSPRISTVNNQKAIIKAGQDQFFVTGVSTSTVVTGASTVPTQDITLTPFFSGVTLDVTPQIRSDGTIILHIHPAISQVQDQQKDITLGNNGTNTPNTFVLPLALSTIRESDNIVRAKNGQVVVIGGLIQNDQREEVAGVPLLSKVPIVGPLFRRTIQVSRKVELVILLRPIIADNKAFTNDMRKSSRVMEGMNRGFHEGSLPEVFGNEAEREDAPIFKQNLIN
jgi:MSHA biogenesis protein MshL